MLGQRAKEGKVLDFRELCLEARGVTGSHSRRRSLGHLVNMLSAGLLHSKVAVFPFIISTWLGEERNLKLYKYSVSPNTAAHQHRHLVGILPAAIGAVGCNADSPSLLLSHLLVGIFP